MQQLFCRLYRGDKQVWRFSKRIVCESKRFSNPFSAVGRKEQVKINNENVINSNLRPNVTETDQDGIIPLLDPLDTERRRFDVKSTIIAEDLNIHRSLQSLEDIPGPAVFKLLDKYWKYVPIFGTQLFRSLLINGFTEGQLILNRSVTPLKYLFNEYGPIVRLNGPFTGDIVLIHRPEHVTKVFDEEGDYPTRSGIDILQYYRMNYRKSKFTGPYNSQGVQSMQWLETKKILETPISDQISKQFEKLEMACDEILIRIRQIKNRQDEVPNTFSQELSRWGMECFWILIMSKKMGFLDSISYNESSEPARFIDTLDKAHYYMSRCETGFQFWRFIDTPYSKKLFNACDIIDGIIGKYIRSAQNHLLNDLSKNEKSQSDLTILENLLTNHRMHPEELSTILMDMIILGVNATTNSEAFLLYYLAKNPRIQKRLFDEIVSNIQKKKIITIGTLNSMPYLNACIKECLRLRPPFPYLTRLLSKSITLHGYKIPKGTYLIMANQITSQREENFDDPEKFKPERWLMKSIEDSYPKNSYLPFGKGLRNCIGENIAKLEMMLLTTKIIREFRVEYDYADMNSNFLMMNVPSKPLRFRFVSRN